MRHLDGRSYSWAELAERLIPYAADLGFTHIELLPIMGHPFGGSWGYQPLSQFAPMPELGPPQDFANFVDRLPRRPGSASSSIGCRRISQPTRMAWPNSTDELYEHADPREGFHQDWNTPIFNLGRNEVREFLIASALVLAGTFWRRWAYASMPSPPCSTAIIPAKKANGFPTNMAAAKIWNPSASCRNSQALSRSAAPARC